MSRRKQKRSFSQVVLWALSMMMVLSMVISLVIVALPGPAEPVPTPAPTWTPRPTASPVPSPSPTEPIVGPAVPTATVTATTPLELAPPLQPTPPTATPAAAATVVRVAAAPATASATPPAVARLTFAVAGDSRHNPELYGRVLAAVVESGSEFLVHTGDMVDKGSEEQWQIFEQSMAGFSLPFYPVPGNHDGLGGKLDGYLAHSRAPAAHYALDRGTVHLAMADTHNGGVSAAELAWLRDDLSRTAQPLKMVFMHHPPFDPDGTDHIMAYGNEAVMDLMAEMDVDYVFAGHIHAYVQGERDGVAYYITGGAGAPLYGGHAQAVHHYLLVTVRGRQATVEMIQV